jgi:hypothetical protein
MAMTTRPLSIVARFLRHVALPAVVTGAIALSSHLAFAQEIQHGEIQHGEVGTEHTAASADTAETASGHARVHANGTESSGASARAGAASASTPYTRAGADGAFARARATISGDLGFERSRAVVGVGGTATSGVGEHAEMPSATAQVDLGGGGEARSWMGGTRAGSSARATGRAQTSAVRGDRHASASGRGEMYSSAGVSLLGNHSRALIAGDGEASVGGSRGVGASVRVMGARGRAASGRSYPAGTHSASFSIRPGAR